MAVKIKTKVPKTDGPRKRTGSLDKAARKKTGAINKDIRKRTGALNKGARKRTGSKTKADLPEEPVDELSEDAVAEENESGTEKSPDRIPLEPVLHPAWPSLLVISILSGIGIPFVGGAERLLIGCLAAGALIMAVFKILEYEKNLHEYYMDYPEMTPANKQKKYEEKRKQRRKKHRDKRNAIKLK